MPKITEASVGFKFHKWEVITGPHCKYPKQATKNYTLITIKCECGFVRTLTVSNFNKFPKIGNQSCYDCAAEKLRIGTLLDKDGNKKCSNCQIIKNKDEFFKSLKHKDKLGGQCKVCWRHKRLKHMYKMKEEDLNSLIEKQNGICLLCCKKLVHRINGNKIDKEKEGYIQVDHCHKTGKVRGILCKNCNTGIGHFYDDIEVLQKAIQYLKDSENITTEFYGKVLKT